MIRHVHLVAPVVRAACVACVACVVVVGALVACETTAPETKVVAPKKVVEEKPDVDSPALCTVKAEVDDASSRLRLAELRTRLEKEANADRAAQFGAMLSIANEQDRFHAFHDDSANHPLSVVGPLGECFVYASWKMGDQATGRCKMADDRSKGAAIVDVARAELARRRGQLDEAQTLIDNALSTDNGCAAALIEAARIAAAKNDNTKALAAWERARNAWPKCYLCAVEAAKLTEATTGKDAAVPLWETALSLQPDAPEALKRYGAALAGVDDKKALAAYEKAIDAGQKDTATLMGAEQLAATSGDVDRALDLAEQAAKAQPNEIDAWRAILALSSKKTDDASKQKTINAATQIMRLVDEDVPALVVLGREARAKGDLVQAVLRFDAASRAIAAGRTGGLSSTDLDAFNKDQAALLNELKVPATSTPPKGNANAVVYAVQKTVQNLFVDRLRTKKGMKGSIEVAVVVSESGTVDDVQIQKDTLGDSPVTASVVANLKRSVITGGAKKYSFQMDFQ